MGWLRQLLEWKDEERTATDFVDRFKSEAFQERVYALTPQGRIVDLPQGSTPLDFAYAIFACYLHHRHILHYMDQKIFLLLDSLFLINL